MISVKYIIEVHKQKTLRTIRTSLKKHIVFGHSYMCGLNFMITTVRMIGVVLMIIYSQNRPAIRRHLAVRSIIFHLTAKIILS